MNDTLLLVLCFVNLIRFLLCWWTIGALGHVAQYMLVIAICLRKYIIDYSCFIYGLARLETDQSRTYDRWALDYRPLLTILLIKCDWLLRSALPNI